jgi:hypothetical protein
MSGNMVSRERSARAVGVRGQESSRPAREQTVMHNSLIGRRFGRTGWMESLRAFWSCPYAMSTMPAPKLRPADEDCFGRLVTC